MTILGPGSQYSCVRCSAVINSSLDSVYELFTDDSRYEYDNMYVYPNHKLVILSYPMLNTTGITCKTQTLRVSYIGTS